MGQARRIQLRGQPGHGHFRHSPFPVCRQLHASEAVFARQEIGVFKNRFFSGSKRALTPDQNSHPLQPDLKGIHFLGLIIEMLCYNIFLYEIENLTTKPAP